MIDLESEYNFNQIFFITKTKFHIKDYPKINIVFIVPTVHDGL